MISVIVRKKNFIERKADAVAHDLSLRAFATVEQQCLAFPHQCNG